VHRRARQAVFVPQIAHRDLFAPKLNASMLMTDPPDHTRLRRLVVGAFDARAVEKLRPQIGAIADELLDAVEDAATAGPVDMMTPIAAGVPAADRDRFRTAVGPLLTTQDPCKVATIETSVTNVLGSSPCPSLLALLRHRGLDDR